MTTVPVSLHALLTTPFAPSPPVRWERARWQEWGERMGADFVLPAVEETVGRADVAQLVDDELARGRTAAAFVAAMVWTYGPAADGPYRTATVLGGRRRPAGVEPEVVATLDDAAGAARATGTHEVHRAHRSVAGRRLHGLTPAALTGWLHFTSARRDPYAAHAAPVLDDAVRGWLEAEGGLALRDGHPDDYARYVDRLVQWGRPFGRTPVQVESSVRTLLDGRA